MSVSLTPLARQQFNQGGIPLAGGKLFTYAAGTTTKRATYTDSTGGTPNTNPIILDANGQCDVWLTDGQAYKFVLSPSTDTDPPTNPYWTEDGISNNILPLNPTFGNVAITGNLTVAGTINKVTITQPATGAQLSLANNSVLATAGAFLIALTATGTTSVTLPTGGTLARNDQATDTFGALTDITTNNVSTTAHGFTPKLPSNAMQFLNGVGAWAAAPAQMVVRSARTSNTILAGADNASLVDITSGTFSQTFTAAATLGGGWYVWYRNGGTGDVTLAPSQNIDGLASFIMYPGEARLIQCDGSVFTSIVVSPFSRTFTSSGTFTKPPGYNYFGGEMWSGGASGQRASGSTNGGSGSGGAACLPFVLPASVVGATETVTIGAGGLGVSVDGPGNVGGSSSFGALITTAKIGFNPFGAVGSGASPGGLGGSIGQSADFQGGTAGVNGVGGTSFYGGGGGAGNNTDATAYNGGRSTWGGGGGGCCGGLGGASLFGGAGGPGTVTGGGDGVAPGGGGGGCKTGTSGAGARGELRIRGLA